MEQDHKKTEYVSRVHTPSGIYKIGDTKVSGHSCYTVKTLEHMVNNSEIECIVSPPRPKSSLVHCTEVIKYPLESELTPTEMYRRSYLAKKNEYLMQEGSTEKPLKRRFFDTSIDLVQTSAKSLKTNSNSSYISPSPTSSTASTVVLDVSEDANSYFFNATPTSSTKETVTFESPQMNQLDESDKNEKMLEECEPSKLIAALDLAIMDIRNKKVFHYHLFIYSLSRFKIFGSRLVPSASTKSASFS